MRKNTSIYLTIAISTAASTVAATIFYKNRADKKIDKLNKKIELLDILARHRNSLSDLAINNILTISEYESIANFDSLSRTTQDEIETIQYNIDSQMSSINRGFVGKINEKSLEDRIKDLLD